LYAWVCFSFLISASFSKGGEQVTLLFTIQVSPPRFRNYFSKCRIKEVSARFPDRQFTLNLIIPVLYSCPHNFVFGSIGV
jgi:hypothetical protein